jgi:hypothetical protein
MPERNLDRSCEGGTLQGGEMVEQGQSLLPRGRPQFGLPNRMLDLAVSLRHPELAIPNSCMLRGC